MRVFGGLFLGLVLLAGAPSTQAAELVVQVADSEGNPVPDAVVALASQGAEASALAARAPARAGQGVVDQRNETFLPYVEIVPLGGEVVFRNSDLTRHHVYSFSPAKAFEFVLAPGEVSEPVKFARTGVVAIGCNIHDQMVAYLYVTDLPWAVLTDKQGRATFADVPDGAYQLHTWHPRLRPGRPEPTQPVTLAGTAGQLGVTLALLREPRHAHDPERTRY